MQPETLTEAIANAKDTVYFEETITLESGGLRLTLFVQRFRNVHAQTPDEVDRQVTLMNVWDAFQNLRRFGRARR